MNSKRVFFIGMGLLIMIVDYCLAIFIADCLNIKEVVFKSITGMSPDLKGKTMIFIIIVFIEGMIGINLFDKKKTSK